MLVQVLTGDVGEDAECHAGKLLEVVLLQYKGQVDNVSTGCSFALVILTHCDLVTPYGDKDLGQHAWRHQAITWTNVDWSSVKSSDIHIRAISQEMPQPSITEIFLKITCLKFHSNFLGAKELSIVSFRNYRFNKGQTQPWIVWRVETSFIVGCKDFMTLNSLWPSNTIWQHRSGSTQWSHCMNHC